MNKGKLIFLSGDYITNSKGMDAIVNAANKYMIQGSGIFIKQQVLNYKSIVKKHLILK